ncbi:uracil-DNA glycosylase family protein, partial [Kaarinaea lacus]
MAMTDVQKQYLQAMGIQTWVSRQSGQDQSPLHPLRIETHEAPLETLSSPTSVERLPTSGKGDASVNDLGWEALQQRVLSCNACELCKTRTQAVFGVGNQSAQWMVVGEAPGADEDRQGEPFVGRAGQLLNNMLLAIGLKREEVYIANILKCRPPNNRDPKPEEVAQCEAYLRRQVALIQPKIILAVGRIAAQNLLKTDINLGRLRGNTYYYEDS